MKAVVDNDILLKGACYGLLEVLVGRVPNSGVVGVLGASRFVVPQRIARAQLRGDPATAAAHFSAFLSANEVVEPNAEEQQMAAVFEVTAQRASLNLDAGESQLVAILVSRCLPWLLTGDKRAISSIEGLLEVDVRLKAVIGKVKCLEQLVVDLLVSGNQKEIRRAICAEPSVDKALSICFSCSSSDEGPDTTMEGLSSYISDLRKKASRVLAT